MAIISNSTTSTSNSNSTTTTTVETCLYFCDLQRNDTAASTTTTTTTTGFCPPACLAICPSLCHYSLSSLILPPSFSPPQPNNPHNLSPLLISMLIILASAFLLITFYLLYTKLYFHLYHHNPQTRINNNRTTIDNNNNNNPLDEEQGPTVVFHPIWYIPTVGLNPSLINSIPVLKYHVMTEKGHVTDCAVCLAEFQQGEELRVLPKCDHAFHIPCIDTWLRSHTNCPLCRAPVVIHTDQTAQNSSSSPADGSAAEAEDCSPASDGELRIEIIRSASMNCVEDKEMNSSNKASGSSSSSQSERWSLERGAVSLVSRSMSCSAKIFSSRYNNNHRPSPNS